MLHELFEIKVFRSLRDRDLLSRKRMELTLSWPHSGLNVHVGGVITPDDKAFLTRVAGYTLRAPVVISHISYDRTYATERIDPHGPHSVGLLEIGFKRADTPPALYHPPPQLCQSALR